MPRDVELLKAALVKGGARPTQFEVDISFPAAGGVGVLPNIRALCKAAALPASTVGVIEVGYQGRKIKYAGDRTFEPWTITVYNDETFDIRDAFLSWMNAINQHRSNIRANGATDEAASYKGSAIVSQLSKDGVPNFGVRAYQMFGCFPSEVSAIELDWDSNDTIETFTVTLQYDYWTPYKTGGTNEEDVYGPGSEPVA